MCLTVDQITTQFAFVKNESTLFAIWHDKWPSDCTLPSAIVGSRSVIGYMYVYCICHISLLDLIDGMLTLVKLFDFYCDFKAALYFASICVPQVVYRKDLNRATQMAQTPHTGYAKGHTRSSFHAWAWASAYHISKYEKIINFHSI